MRIGILRQATELLRHQFTEQRRSDSRARTSPGWLQGRPMFTYADSRPVQPEYLTHCFRALVRELGLPPIRLHDLRHGAATLALASHTDLKVIQQMLGHSSIVGPAHDPGIPHPCPTITKAIGCSSSEVSRLAGQAPSAYCPCVVPG